MSLIDWGSAFDWITPIRVLLEGLEHGKGHDFLVPIDHSPLTGNQIKRLLDGQGVESWGYMIPALSNTLMLSVRKSQARKAEEIMSKQGIPTEGEVPDEAPFETEEDMREWYEREEETEDESFPMEREVREAWNELDIF